MKLSIILPFYNEEQQIPITLETVSSILETLKDGLTFTEDQAQAFIQISDYEIVCIDDGSKDHTWPMLKQMSQQNQKIRAIHFSRNFGKEAAICAGMDTVTGDAVILMDGDLQHPPSYFPKMVYEWLIHGYEVVEGFKSKRQKEGIFSRFAARSFYKLFKTLGGIDLQNASDFKLLDRKVIDAWCNLTERTTFFRGLSAWLGFKRTTFEFKVADRTTGKSKWSLKNLFKLSTHAVTSFSARPLQLITFMGILSVILALVLGIQTLIKYLSGHAASGFTTVILLLLLMGGSIMVSLGIIGSYIGRIYDEIKGRPRYIISEIISANDPQIEQLNKKNVSNIDPSNAQNSADHDRTIAKSF